MARACLRSLAAAEPGALLVLCNQGYLDTAAWQAELAPLALDVVIVGDGTNLGIAAGREGPYDCSPQVGNGSATFIQNPPSG